MLPAALCVSGFAWHFCLWFTFLSPPSLSPPVLSARGPCPSGGPRDRGGRAGSCRAHASPSRALESERAGGGRALALSGLTSVSVLLALPRFSHFSGPSLSLLPLPHAAVLSPPLYHPCPSFTFSSLLSSLRLLYKEWVGSVWAGHPAADDGLGIGEELVSEWQMLLLSPPTTHLMPQWKCGSGPL